jgi:hypothetical protein
MKAKCGKKVRLRRLCLALASLARGCVPDGTAKRAVRDTSLTMMRRGVCMDSQNFKGKKGWKK